MLSPSKLFVLALVAIPALVATSRADQLKELLKEKFQVAEILEAAAYAGERCPGFHVIEDNVMATADELGVRDNDIYAPQWKFWEARGQTNARIGYEKDPAGWCESMWHFLGPDHPPVIKHALLNRD